MRKNIDSDNVDHHETLDIKYYEKIVGEIPASPKISIITWARKPPKDIFKRMVEIARISHPKNECPQVYVDDMCSMLEPDNPIDLQIERNLVYQTFFNNLGCELTFSSSLFKSKDAASVLRELVLVGYRMPIHKFLQFLPISRRSSCEINATDYCHMLFELRLMNEAAKKNNCLLTGSFSEMMVHAHRTVSSSPMTGLIIPRLY